MRHLLIALAVIASMIAPAHAQTVPQSRLLGIEFEDQPVTVPDQEGQIRGGLDRISNRIGHPCVHYESLGWKLERSDQARVDAIHAGFMRALNEDGWTVTPVPAPAGRAGQVFRVEQDGRTVLALWIIRRNVLGLVMCSSSEPAAKPGGLTLPPLTPPPVDTPEPPVRPAATPETAPAPAPAPAPAGATEVVVPPRSGQARPGVLSGRITNRGGKPIDQSNVRLLVSLSGKSIDDTGAIATFNPKVDANGVWRQEVPPGIYRIEAEALLTYNRKGFRFDLWPTDDQPQDTEFDSRRGAVRDFVWKLSGMEPGEISPDNPLYHYGSRALVHWIELGPKTYPYETKVRWTFKPRGPMVDGLPGHTVVRDLTIRDSAIFDLPTGPYTVSAEILAPHGSQRVKFVKHSCNPCTEVMDSVDIDFESDIPFRTAAPWLNAINGTTR